MKTDAENTILFFSPVVWDGYPYRDQRIPELLSGHFRVIYVCPLRYRNWQKADQRLHSLIYRKVPEDMEIIWRFSIWPRSVFSFVKESLNNRKLIKRFKPAAVVISDHLMAYHAMRYCKKKHIPFLFDITDDWDHVQQTRFPRMFWQGRVKPFVKRNAFIVTSSKNIYNRFLQDSENVFWFPNAVDASRFKLSDTSEKRINIIGSLRACYDFEMLGNVCRSFPELEIHIYGSGEQESLIRQMARDHENFIFHASVDHAEVPSLIEDSLFGIIPLKNELVNQATNPIKLFEYWAAGKTVIATETEDLKSYGDDGLMLYQTEDHLMQQIRALLEDESLRKRNAGICRKRTENQFNYDSAAKEFRRIINQMIKEFE